MENARHFQSRLILEGWTFRFMPQPVVDACTFGGSLND